MGTSVSRRFPTIFGGILSVAFVCLGSGEGKQAYLGLWFLPVWHGGIPDSIMLLLSYCLCSGGRCPLFPLFVAFVVYGSSGVSLFSLCFCPFFRFCPFVGLLKPLGSFGVGGHHWGGRPMPGGFRLVMLGRISFVFLFFLLLQLATGL